MLGSDAEQVVRNAHVPMLLIRADHAPTAPTAAATHAAERVTTAAA